MKEQKQSNYPKVLLINEQCINSNNATGITLRSLWRSWPTERLFELYRDQRETVKGEKLIVPSGKLFSFVSRRLEKRSALVKANDRIKEKNDNEKKSVGKMRQAAVLLYQCISVSLDTETFERIQEFAPEVIYTLGGSPFVLNAVHKLSAKLKIPVIIHFMDNWVEHYQWEENKWTFFYRTAMDRALRRCVQRARCSVVISPQMANAYQRIFNTPQFVLMNSVDVNGIHCSRKEEDDIVRFVYAGGLHLQRYKALKEIAEAIQNANLRNDKQGVLAIYTSEAEFNRVALEFAGLPVEYCKPVGHEQIKRIFKDADVLVHTEVANVNLEGFFCYSISTKIPEYLSSGRTILFYGPSDMGLTQYLKQGKSAVVVSSRRELNEKIHLLIENPFQKEIIENAKKMAENNHCIDKAHETLLSAIKYAVSESVN